MNTSIKPSITMRADTARQVKIDIEYTESKKVCLLCTKYKEIDGIVGKLDTCNLFPHLGPMIVRPDGTCRHWEKPESPCS